MFLAFFLFFVNCAQAESFESRWFLYNAANIPVEGSYVTSTKIELRWPSVSLAEGYLVHRNYQYLFTTTNTSVVLANHRAEDNYSIAAFHGSNIGPSSTLEKIVEAPAQSLGKVFPGAEGFGTDTNAGNFGKVCSVITLADSGPGSLRDCVTQHGARRIHFSISGTIKLHSTLNIENPDLSIFGQTAPNSGILLTTENWVDGPVLSVQTHDVLIQHMRIRAGIANPGGTTCCRDAVSIGSETLGSVYNVVLDHNSMSWGTDEVVEIWFDAHDITVSRNLISEGLHHANNVQGSASRGLLAGNRSHSISIHHNVFAHNVSRNPAIANSGVNDVVNNIIYHWVDRGAELSNRHGDVKANFVKNLFIAHTAPSAVHPSHILWKDIHVINDSGYTLSAYLEGNIGHWRTAPEQPELALMATKWATPYNPDEGLHSNTRYWAPTITEIPAIELEAALLNDIGATLPRRDTIDARVVNEIKWRSGFIKDCISDCQYSAGGWSWMD